VLALKDKISNLIIPSPHLVVAVAISVSSYQPTVGKFYLVNS